MFTVEASLSAYIVPRDRNELLTAPFNGLLSSIRFLLITKLSAAKFQRGNDTANVSMCELVPIERLLKLSGFENKNISTARNSINWVLN